MPGGGEMTSRGRKFYESKMLDAAVEGGKTAVPGVVFIICYCYQG
jgi:hypothetical protein